MIKNLLQVYINGLKNIFKLKWRMSKYDFCYFMTVYCIVCLLVKEGISFAKNIDYLWLFLVLITIIPYLAIGHRLQDMGKSGFRLLLYMIAFWGCYFMCVTIVGCCVKFIIPLKTHAPLMSVLPDRMFYVVKYGQYLSFLVFLFFAYKWIFGDGDKKANEFGKEVKQKRVNNWFKVLPLFFVTYVISFPLTSIAKAVVYYSA